MKQMSFFWKEEGRMIANSTLFYPNPLHCAGCLSAVQTVFIYDSID